MCHTLKTFHLTKEVIMKKNIFFKQITLVYVFSIVVMSLATAIEAAPLFVVPPSSTQNQTQQISIPLTLNNVNSLPIQGIDLQIEYDANILSATNVSLTGTILENVNYLFDYNTSYSGYIYIGIAAVDTIYTSTGLLLNLDFTVTGTSGETSDITFAKAWLNDNSYETSHGLFTVAPNSPPEMDSIASQIFDEDTTHSIPITLSDIESDPCDLTLSIVSSDIFLLPNENISISGTCAQRTIMLAPATNASGFVTLTLTISDGLLSSDHTIEVTISEINDAPQMEIIVDHYIDEDTALSTLAITATDIDSESCDLTITFDSSDSFLLPGGNMSYTCSDGIYYLSMIPSANLSGSSLITVTVSDAQQLSVSQSFTLYVNSINDIPFVSTIPDQNTYEDTTISSINFTASDIESSASNLDISITSSDQTILSNSNISLAYSAADLYTITATPNNNKNGTVILTVSVTDSGGLSSTNSFNLTILPVNDSPVTVSSIQNQIISEDIFYTFTVDVNTFTDPDNGDVLSYTAMQFDGNSLPSWLTFEPSTRTFNGLPENSHVGMLSITVLASDPYAQTAMDTFQLTITNTNDAPVVEQTIPDQTATEDQIFTFDVDPQTFSDDDTIFNDALTYTATLDNDQVLPSWLAFDPSNLQFNGTPDNADVDSILIKMSVSDLSLETVSTTFTLTINNANDSPVLMIPIPDQYATEDVLFDFTIASGSFEDDDIIHGDELSYTATLNNGSPLPDWLTFNAQTQQFSGTPLNEDVGVISIEVSVSDNSHALISDIFLISIQNVNDTPQISAISDQVIDEDDTTGELTFTISDLETSADMLVVSGKSSDQSLITDDSIVFSGTNGSRSVQVTPISNAFGTSDITVFVSDGDYTSTTIFMVTVTAVNDSPTLANAIIDQNSQEDVAFNFTFALNTFSDIDLTTGDVLTYSAKQTNNQSLPDWLSFNAGTRTFSGTPLNDDVALLSVRVTATDTQMASISDDFDIIINNTNDAPTLAIPIDDQHAIQDENFYFALNSNTFTDDDIIHGDSLTYTAQLSNGTSLPDWLTFNSSTLEFSGTPDNNDTTDLSIEVKATDSENAYISDIFMLYVKDINYAPVISVIPDQTIDELTASTPYNFNVSDMDSINVTVDAVSTDQVLIPNDHISLTIIGGDTYSISISPVIGQVGSATISISASDGLSSTTQTFLVIVQEAYLNVSGHVSYYKSVDSHIDSVVITASGTRNYSTTTDINGDYVLSVRPGDYTLLASRTGDVGKLTLSDAIQILKFVAKIVSLDCNEIIAADVTQNSTNSAMDASKVARYVAGAESCMNDQCQLWSFMTVAVDSCDTWPPITYQQEYQLNNLTGDLLNQDFIGIFLGDIVE